MTFVCQPNKGVIKGCYLDQLGLFPVFFLRQSSWQQVRKIREDRKLDRVHTNFPDVTRYNCPTIRNSGLCRFILVQFSHSFLIPISKDTPNWPPCIHISRSCKDSRKWPAAFNLNGCCLWRWTVKQRGDKLVWPAPTSKGPDCEIGIQSHHLEAVAAGVIKGNMCINLHLCINKRIYLIMCTGAGSWSFRGVQAVVLDLEKSALSDPAVGPLSVPVVCEWFIMVYYQYLESLVWDEKDQRHPPQTYTLPSASSAWEALSACRGQ